eukprot:4856989-Prymnesium_polylepis.3
MPRTHIARLISARTSTSRQPITIFSGRPHSRDCFAHPPLLGACSVPPRMVAPSTHVNKAAPAAKQGQSAGGGDARESPHAPHEPLGKLCVHRQQSAARHPRSTRCGARSAPHRLPPSARRALSARTRRRRGARAVCRASLARSVRQHSERRSPHVKLPTLGLLGGELKVLKIAFPATRFQGLQAEGHINVSLRPEMT